MMTRISKSGLVILVITLVLVVSIPTLAQEPTITIEVLIDSFAIEREFVRTMDRYGMDRTRQAGMLYLYDMAGVHLDNAELDRIVRTGESFQDVAWRLGVPPVIFDGDFSWSRPVYDKSRRNPGRWPEEREERGRNFYQYTYEDRPSGIEEKIYFTQDKYELEYETRRIEEELEVDLRKMTYEYEYENTSTRQEIERDGQVFPITTRNIRRYLLSDRVIEEPVRPGIRLQFEWKIN